LTKLQVKHVLPPPGVVIMMMLSNRVTLGILPRFIMVFIPVLIPMFIPMLLVDLPLLIL
jgi:hypothetical protein